MIEAIHTTFLNDHIITKVETRFESRINTAFNALLMIGEGILMLFGNIFEGFIIRLKLIELSQHVLYRLISR